MLAFGASFPLIRSSRALPLRLKRRMITASSMKKIATHDGSFHCDEVLACHMLRKHTSTFRDALLVRSRDPEILATADIIVDVGAKYDPSNNWFDHHQRGFSSTFEDTGKRSKTKLSSAGLVYKHFGLEIVKDVLLQAEMTPSDEDVQCIYMKVYDCFMEAIDAIDNGISVYESDQPPRYESSTDLSARVDRFNAEWFEQNPDQDGNFLKAMAMAGVEFDDCVKHAAKSWLPARSIVAKALKKRFEDDSSGRTLVMREWAPWKDHLFIMEEDLGIPDDQKVLYVVYKDMTGGSWRLQCVPVAKGSFQSRRPLPEAWRGIRDEQLSGITGIPNCIFVHAAGFIGGNRDFDGAMKMARAAMELPA